MVSVSFDKFIVRGNDVIQRWQPAVSLSQDLLSDLVNQETGIRGYALSSNTALLQPYDQYRSQETVDETKLRSLVYGHPGLVADIGAFASSATQWRADIATPFIERVGQHDPAGSAAMSAGLAAKSRFDIIRQRAARLTADLVTVRDAAGRPGGNCGDLRVAGTVGDRRADAAALLAGLARASAQCARPDRAAGGTDPAGRRGCDAAADPAVRPARTRCARRGRGRHARPDRRGPRRGGTGPSRTAPAHRRAGPLERRPRAVRLRGLARPLRAAAQGRELLPAAGAAVRRPARRQGSAVHRLRSGRCEAHAGADQRSAGLLSGWPDHRALRSRAAGRGAHPGGRQPGGGDLRIRGRASTGRRCRPCWATSRCSSRCSRTCWPTR